MIIADYWFLGIIVLGFLLKYFNVVKNEDGLQLMRLVFYTTLPALIITSIQEIYFSMALVFIPLVILFFIFGVFAFAYPITKSTKLNRKMQGSLLLSCIIMNTGFFYPFVEAFFDAEGVALLSMFDVANAIVMFSFIYFFASTYNEVVSVKQVLKKVFLSPPLIAIVIGFSLLLFQISIPGWLFQTLSFIGKGNTLFLMLAMGILLELKFHYKFYVLYTIFLRMILGLALAFIAVEMLGLTGLMRTLTLMLGIAPSGFNTVVFAALEDLDVEYAVGVLSLTLLLSMILTPIVLTYL